MLYKKFILLVWVPIILFTACNSRLSNTSTVASTVTSVITPMSAGIITPTLAEEYVLYVLTRTAVFSDVVMETTVMTNTTLTTSLHLTSINPPPHSLGVSPTVIITTSFDANLNTSSLTSQTLVVYGTQSGVITGTPAYDWASRTVRFAPDHAFFAGEEVRVTATSGLHNQTGDALPPYQWQFTVGPVTSRCVDDFSRAAIALTHIKGNVAWGDYDNDGDLDILLNGDSSNGYVTEIWRNDSRNTFNQIPTTFPDITGGIAWGDYDNDGDLDILLAGWSMGGEPITEIWRNDGRDVFNQIPTTLPGIGGQVAWGDYDNDGDLDFILNGTKGKGDYTTQIWRNDGLDTFSQVSTILPRVVGQAVWGDYDNDGDLDILLSGAKAEGGFLTEIWRNDGLDTFSRLPITLTGIGWSNVTWGDYDNDGDLDILLNGMTKSTEGEWLVSMTEVWRNDGLDTFNQVAINLPGVAFGDVAWGDYDNDGDLDILLAGSNNTEIWRNDNQDIFSQVAISATDLWDYANVDWGDYDNDGDLDILLSGCIDECIGVVTEVWRNNDCLDEATVLHIPKVINQMHFDNPVVDALIDPASNRLYVLDKQGGLKVLGMTDNKEIAHLETGFQDEKYGYVGAGELSIDPGRNRLYISKSGDNTPIRMVDTKALTVTTYSNFTGQVTPHPTQDYLYLTNECITHILDADTWAELGILLPFGTGTPHPLGQCLLSTRLDTDKQFLYGITQECAGGCTGVRISVYDVFNSPQYISSIGGNQVAFDPLHQRVFTSDFYLKHGSRSILRYDVNNLDGKVWSQIDASGLIWQTIIYDPEYDRLYADSTGKTDAIFDGNLNLLAEPEFPGSLLTFDPATHYFYSSDDEGILFVFTIGTQR